MKKLLCLLALAAGFVFGQTVDAQDQGDSPRPRQNGNRRGDGQRPQRPPFMTEDGKIDLSKLGNNMPAERVEAMKKADKDGDGFLSAEEQKGANLFQGMGGPRGDRGPGQGGDRGPGQGGPGQGRMGGPGRVSGPGNFNPQTMVLFRQLRETRTEDGKYELAKLPADFDETLKKELVAADKDKDGFLTQADITPIFFTIQIKSSILAEAVTEDGKIDLAKLPKKLDKAIVKELRKADKDKDKLVTFEELQAADIQIPGVRMLNRRGMGGGMFGEAMQQDGRVDLSKLPKSMDRSTVKNMKKADKDKDGFLDREELKAIFPNMPQPGQGFRGPGMGQGRGQGMRFRGPGPVDPIGSAKTEDGKIDLSKLPEAVDGNMRQAMKAADKDNDGFLDAKEQRSVFPDK